MKIISEVAQVIGDVESLEIGIFWMNRLIQEVTEKKSSTSSWKSLTDDASEGGREVFNPSENQLKHVEEQTKKVGLALCNKSLQEWR